MPAMRTTSSAATSATNAPMLKRSKRRNQRRRSGVLNIATGELDHADERGAGGNHHAPAVEQALFFEVVVAVQHLGDDIQEILRTQHAVIQQRQNHADSVNGHPKYGDA